MLLHGKVKEKPGKSPKNAPRRVHAGHETAAGCADFSKKTF